MLPLAAARAPKGLMGTCRAPDAPVDGVDGGAPRREYPRERPAWPGTGHTGVSAFAPAGLPRHGDATPGAGPSGRAGARLPFLMPAP